MLAVLCALAGAPAEAAPGRVAQAAPGATPGTAGQRAAATDRAYLRVESRVRERERARADKAALDRRYATQLAELDRLKQQRASWRRDRQIRERMSESHGTAQKLARIDARIRQLDSQLTRDRRALIQAIDRELGQGPPAARKDLLARWRGAAQRTLAPGVKKIVIPDDSIDPLADPEELEHQAALLSQSEALLARELDRLERQARRYHHMAELRAKRSRAAELGGLEDNQPRRTTGRVTTRASGDTAAPVFNEDTAESAPSGDTPTDSPPLETPSQTDVPDLIDDPMFAVILADVVDASTLHALRAAESSSDPAVKARAAAQARAQVQQRLSDLQKRRKLIQTRARTLRGQ